MPTSPSNTSSNKLTTHFASVASLILIILTFAGMLLPAAAFSTGAAISTPIFAAGSGATQAEVSDSNDSNDTLVDSQPETLTEYIGQSLDAPFSETTENEEREKRLKADKLRVNNELTGEYNQAYYEVESLNVGLPPLSPEPNLQTPLATLEFLNTAMLQKRFSLAAYALNLNPIEVDQQPNVAPQLARKLDYILSQKGLYVFDRLPDRADGLIEPPMGSSSSIKGIPRRSIKLGYVDFKDRKVPIYIERIKAKDKPPVWVFSAQTVANIDALYNLHKPAEFERYLPYWLTAEIIGVSTWEILLLIFFILATLGIGYLISKGVEYVVNKYTDHIKTKYETDELSVSNRSLADLFSKITVPLTTTISMALVFTLVSGSLPKISTFASSLRPLIWLGLIFSSLWLGIRTINFFANRYRDFQIRSLGDQQLAKQRKRMTYVSIFRRIFILVIVTIGVWFSLAEFTDLSGLGTTLLTSAGIAGAVIGIAAQPTLGNIIASFQVALTQPIRIRDTVMVEGIWCEVEDLRYTYAVLKTWDSRRLIIPMKYFVTEVIENWSHTDTEQSSAVYLYVDYGANIEAIKDKYIEILENHELADDSKSTQFLVYSMTEEYIKLRMKVTSNNPANAWALECDVRKQMLEYLVNEQPEHLPTERITLAKRNLDHNNSKGTAKSKNEVLDEFDT